MGKSQKTEVQRLKYALADCADFADFFCRFHIIRRVFFCILNFQNFVFQLIATQSSAKSAKSARIFIFPKSFLSLDKENFMKFLKIFHGIFLKFEDFYKFGSSK